MPTIKVAATSANFCIGFDVCGIALNIYNKFEFNLSLETKLYGFDEPYSNLENNLLYYSYKYVFDLLNKEILPIEVKATCNIPISRGLGSSASLIVGGVFIANEVLNRPLSTDELFNIATKIEGHPDNVAPAIFGFFCTSYKKDDTYIHTSYDVSDKLKFIAVIPDEKVSTKFARSVLKDTYTKEEIVNNLSRIINLPKALTTGDFYLLNDLLHDSIHEPFRAKLIKEYLSIKKICDDNESILIISGSGSSMLIISKSYDIVDKIKCDNVIVKPVLVSDGVKILYE